MASAQVVETSVTNNSPSQDSNHPDDLFQSRLVNFLVNSRYLLLVSPYLIHNYGRSCFHIASLFFLGGGLKLLYYFFQNWIQFFTNRVS